MTNLSTRPSLTSVPDNADIVIEDGRGNRPRGLPITLLESAINGRFFNRVEDLRRRVQAFGPINPPVPSAPVITSNDGRPISLTLSPGTSAVITLAATGYPKPDWVLSGPQSGLFEISANGEIRFRSPSTIGNYSASATATNSEGASSITVSVSVVAVAVSPVIVVSPKINGDAVAGSFATLTPGAWSGSPTPDVVYNWRRRVPGAAIWESLGFTSGVYAWKAFDIGYEFSVLEVATNSSGVASAESNIIGPVVAAATVCQVQIAAPISSSVDVPLAYQLSMASGSCTAWQTKLLTNGSTGGVNGSGAVIGQIAAVGTGGSFTQNVSNLSPGDYLIWAKCNDAGSCSGSWVTRPVKLTIPSTQEYVAPFGQNAADYPKITFRDEFNGTSLDSTKWITKEPWWGANNGNLNNFAVEDSKLKIWLGRFPNGDFEFLNRAINTHGKFFQKWGFFEISAKLPRGVGFWPSFWLYGYDHNNGPTTEIDIMEAYGNPSASSYWTDGNHNLVSYGGTVWYGPPQNPTRVGMYKLRDTLKPNGVNLSAGFHRYACRWDVTGVIFYFDGEQIGPKIVAYPGMGVTELPIIIAMGPGDAARPTAGIPTQQTVDAGLTVADKSNSYEIEYVRCWSLADGSTTVR